MNGFINLRRTPFLTQDESDSTMPALPMGRLREGNMLDGEMAFWRSMEGHAAVVGATGRGKSAYIAIPWLLLHKGPAVVVDIKGELYRKTSRHRSTLGPVAALDPFNMLPAHVDRACLNPMTPPDMASENDAQELLRSFAETVQPIQVDPYWDSSAQNLIYVAALIARSKHGNDANPGHVNSILNRGKAHLMKDIKEAATEGGTLGLAAGAMLGGIQVDTTFACYMLGASRAMMFMVPEGVANAVSSTTVNPADIMGRNGTLYLVMPEDKLASHAGLVRMWLGGVLRAARLLGDDPSRNALFLVDEAGNLGNMREVMLALTLGRSKGVRLATFWQDMAQMRAAYGDEGRMFMSNSSMRLFLGTNDLQDSRYVSEVLGSDMHGQPLLSPEQVRAVPKGVVLACQDGMMPMALDAIRSWEDETTAALMGIAGEDWAGWCERRLETVTKPPEHAVYGQVRDKQGRLFLPVLANNTSPMMRAQRAVFDALRLSESAPDGITAIYDKARVPPTLRGDPYSPQVDVLVVDGMRGVLLLEVKGGMVRWKPEEAAWEVRTLKGQKWRPCKDPYEQVRACAYALVEALRRKGLPYVHVRTAVAFPDMDEANGAMPADAVNILTYWKGDISMLWERLGKDWKGGPMPRSVQESILSMTYGQLDITKENQLTEHDELPSPLYEIPGDGELLEARKSMVCVLASARHITIGQVLPTWAAEGAGRRLAMVEGLDAEKLELLVEKGLREFGAEGFLHALDRECGKSWEQPIKTSPDAELEFDDGFDDSSASNCLDDYEDTLPVISAAERLDIPEAVVEGWKTFEARRSEYESKSKSSVKGNYVSCSEEFRSMNKARLDLARLCSNHSPLLRFMDAMSVDAYNITSAKTLESAINEAAKLSGCSDAVAQAQLYMEWKKGSDVFGNQEPPVDAILACDMLNNNHLLRYLNSLSQQDSVNQGCLTMIDYQDILARESMYIENEFVWELNEDGEPTCEFVDDPTLNRPRRDWPTSEKAPRYATP